MTSLSGTTFLPTRPCACCGREFAFLPEHGFCLDCEYVNVTWHLQLDPPPMSDEDTYMIINHYRGI